METIKEEFKIRHGSRNERKVALTFDDGPNPYFTEKILDVLKQFKVSASFFLIGRWAGSYPHTVKRIHSEGHSIGNHSYSHGGDNDKGDFGDYQRCEEVLEEIIGFTPQYMRVPGFGYEDRNRIRELNASDLEKRKYLIIDHEVDSEDISDNISTHDIANNVLQNVEPGSIVVCHDGCGSAIARTNTSLEQALKNRPAPLLEALPKIIESLKHKGFELVSLDEMTLIEV